MTRDNSTARAAVASLFVRSRRLPRSYMHARTPARTRSDVAETVGACAWTAAMLAGGQEGAEACAGR